MTNNLEYTTKSHNDDYEDEFWTDFPKQAKPTKNVLPSINTSKTMSLLNSRSLASLKITSGGSRNSGKDRLDSGSHNITKNYNNNNSNNKPRKLNSSKSWNNLKSPLMTGKVLDRRPRVGWGFKDNYNSVEDIQEQLYRVKKNSQKISQDNTKLKSRNRRLERELRKREKTVQSLLSAAVDERDLQPCDLIQMLKTEQSSTMALKKENDNLKKEITIADQTVKTLQNCVKHSHLNEIHKKLQLYSDEVLELRERHQQQMKINNTLEKRNKNNKHIKKNLEQDIINYKKMLTHSKKNCKRIEKVSGERLENIQNLKYKLTSAETRLEENLRTLSNLKCKMARFERQFRRQMHCNPGAWLKYIMILKKKWILYVKKIINYNIKLLLIMIIYYYH